MELRNLVISHFFKPFRGRRSIAGRSLGLALAFAVPGIALGSEVAVIVSKDIPLYQEAAASFTQALPEGNATTYIFPSDAADSIATVMEEVKADRPRVVVAVGAKAAAESMQALPGVPLVYLMVVYPEKLGLLDQKNAYGISWQPSPALLARTFHSLLPNAQHFGMMSSLPEKDWAALSQRCAKEGIELVISKISDASEVPSALRDLSQKGMDALWMGADPALASESSYEISGIYAFQNKIPMVLPFRPMKPNKNKALAGITVTSKLAGTSAARLVKQLMAGKKPKEPLTFPIDVEISIDPQVAYGLGITLSEEIQKIAVQVFH